MLFRGSAKFYSLGNWGVKKWPGPQAMGSSGFPVASLISWRNPIIRNSGTLEIPTKINGFSNDSTGTPVIHVVKQYPVYVTLFI